MFLLCTYLLHETIVIVIIFFNTKFLGFYTNMFRNMRVYIFNFYIVRIYYYNIILGQIFQNYCCKVFFKTFKKINFTLLCVYHTNLRSIQKRFIKTNDLPFRKKLFIPTGSILSNGQCFLPLLRRYRFLL